MKHLNVLVVGASRGTGRAVVESLLASGHEVTAFGRTASTALADLGGLGDSGDGAALRTIDGDVLDPTAVEKAVIGQDAVVVTLGISDNPITVRLFRRASTALDVRSRGTATVVAAMRQHGVRRLVALSAYGVGDSYRRLNLQWKLTYRLLLAPQIADTARQEEVIRTSGLDWTIVRPVALTDEEATGQALVSDSDEIGGFEVSRAQVAEVIGDLLEPGSSAGRVLSVSARRA